MPISLSLRMTSRSLFNPAALLNASKTTPDGSAPSPITATLLRSSPGWAMSSPAFNPRLVDTLAPAWPVTNRS